MAYDRSWDETFPADTQPANQLGQDIRNFKTDTRQRVASFGAGTLANRPTPEAAFVGVTYFATDTSQMFRWSGTAWIDITNNLPSPVLYADHSQLIIVGTTNEVNVVPPITIKGNSLGANGAIRCTFTANFPVSNAAQAHLRYKIDGNTYFQNDPGTTPLAPWAYKTSMIFGNGGTQADQFWLAEIFYVQYGSSFIPSFYYSTGETVYDFTQDHTFSVTWQPDVLFNQFIAYSILVERLSHA